MPSDIIGTDLPGMDAKGNRRPEFSPGPLLRVRFVYYADELNRSPPKTQSALLEAMAEQQVTVNSLDAERRKERTTHLPGFFLIASQNPEAHEGTFPLPEAQLDRFMVKIWNQFLGLAYRERLERTMPLCTKNLGGSLWLQKQ